ncbi:MAG TPA: hypothetical protein VJ826_02335 [Candidatus Polarisedimenticolaceae bacterium]|nr:hypothetical protein [Candidatus Polarisedimenticolaceae bacterium]
MSTFEKWLLWSSTAAVALTGIVFGWMKYFLTGDDPYSAIHHPLQPLVLKLHVLTAPVLVFALGVVYTRHVVRQWRSGRARGRPSGVGIVATLLPMVLSGYLIQTISSESWLFRVAMVHLAASLVYLGTLGAHQVAAWRQSRRAAPRPASPLSGIAAPADPDA